MRSMLSIDDLEDELSLPTAGVLETLQRVPGDVMVLGAGGKMGPTLARMLKRAFDELGQRERQVIAVSRFSDPTEATKLSAHGIQVLHCDLLDRAAVAALPLAPNVIFMAGQKFGTSEAPERTWIMNTLLPALVAEHFAKSRIVVFSTGCVYPLAAVNGAGSRESDPLGPPGDYANSCVGRERVFTHYAKLHNTPMLMYRLSYAIDLRYGVLADVAGKVSRREPVDVTMGFANVIWQGDANARAIQCLERVATPPVALNVTGLERVSIRELARVFGEKMAVPVVIAGEEADRAWVFDASLSYDWFGPPRVALADMIEATANWTLAGGQMLGKPTHFEVRDGDF
jgi:dTDP-4-dehydrorhamnose reductase